MRVAGANRVFVNQIRFLGPDGNAADLLVAFDEGFKDLLFD